MDHFKATQVLLPLVGQTTIKELTGEKRNEAWNPRIR